MTSRRRTLPYDLSVAQAQASLDAFCARVGDNRVRKREGERTNVGALAEAEPHAPLPPAFPATVVVERVISLQALVTGRVPRQPLLRPTRPGRRHRHVSHRLGEHVLDIATTTGTCWPGTAASPTAPACWSATPSTSSLESAMMAAFDSSKPCARKVRRPVSPAALAEAEHLRDSQHVSQRPDEREVVVDLRRYAQAARDRQELARRPPRR